MTKEEGEYAICKNAVSILAVQCAGCEEKIIDLLTGYLWDEEEAGHIKRSDGRFKVLTDADMEKIKKEMRRK